MLSSVLKSDIAIDINIAIMRGFIKELFGLIKKEVKYRRKNKFPNKFPKDEIKKVKKIKDYDCIKIILRKENICSIKQKGIS